MVRTGASWSGILHPAVRTGTEMATGSTPMAAKPRDRTRDRCASWEANTQSPGLANCKGAACLFWAADPRMSGLSTANVRAIPVRATQASPLRSRWRMAASDAGAPRVRCNGVGSRGKKQSRQTPQSVRSLTCRRPAHAPQQCTFFRRSRVARVASEYPAMLRRSHLASGGSFAFARPLGTVRTLYPDIRILSRGAAT